MKVLGHLMQACAPSEPLCPNKPALCSCVRTGLSDWGAFASPQSPRFWLWKQPVGLYLWSRRTVENSAHRCGFTRKTRKIGRWNADQEEKTALREPQAPLTCLLLLIHLLQAKKLDLAETDRTILPAEYTETWYFCFLIQLSIVNEAYSFAMTIQPIREAEFQIYPSHILGSYICSVSLVFVLLRERKQLNFNMKQQLPVLSFTTSNYYSGKGLKIYIKHNSNSPEFAC